MRRLLFALAVCMLAIPAGPAPAQTPASSGRNVCVYAALGQKFEVQTIGLMIFGNALHAASAASWGIDELAVRKIAAGLKPRYAVRRITLPAATAAALEKPVGLFEDRRAPFAAALRAAGGGACDYTITVTRAATAVASTNQAIRGLGMLKRDGIVVQRFVFAVFHLTLFDRQMRQITVKLPSSMDIIVAGLIGPGLRGMYQKIDLDGWPASAQEAVQNALVRSLVRALVDKGIGDMLPEVMAAATGPAD